MGKQPPSNNGVAVYSTFLDNSGKASIEESSEFIRNLCESFESALEKVEGLEDMLRKIIYAMCLV